jgi:hypothetical protein
MYWLTHTQSFLREGDQAATGVPREPRCSFCGKRQSEVANCMIAGAGVFICVGYIDICYSVRQRWPDPK